MDAAESRVAAGTCFSLLLLLLLQAPTGAQEICSARQDIYIPENNTVNIVVEAITVEPGVTLEFKPGTGDIPFRLEGNQLILTEVLDYEEIQSYIIQIVCSQEAIKFNLIIIVFVTNVNDNPPVFSQDLYHVSISEMSPVGTFVSSFPATDLDNPNQLYYTLTSESNDFKLRALTIPDILVNKLLEYDKVRSIQLVLNVQDTPLTSPEGERSYTATTTIVVAITDGDNRPPWFQPCTKYEVGGTLVCQSFGYTGRVNQNEQETGVLPLKPGPLYAIDGDSGINEEVTYSFLSGNEDGVFGINPDSGNITMLKPADVLDTITLTVMAAQKVNSFQFATTTVTVNVQVKSLHPPKFQKSAYDAIITAVGAMAMDMNNRDEPLRLLATDNDYAEGLNPYISYFINGNSDFTIIDGFLFMTKDLPDTTLTLQVTARDTSNDESATAQLSLTVTSGFTTTTLPLSTADITSMTSVGDSTTDTSVSPTLSITSSNMSTEGSVSTTNPILTTEGSSTDSTVLPPTVITPSGRYGVGDMAALGATLGVLLFLCLVVIGLLIHRMRKGKADWKKMYEASMFQSSLGKGSSGHKEGIQYSNEAFVNDEDGDSIGSSGPGDLSVTAGEVRQRRAAELPLNESNMKSLASLHAMLPDDTSQEDSDKADSEKEVKPILTKERRTEDGYKAVWFKEDIDPNAKEEVVIIPDSREDDSQDEGEEQRADLDSGLGVKIEDGRSDDSDDENL